MPEAYYRFRAEIVRRGPGRGMKSALVAAAYRSGKRLEFEREEQTIDYTRRRGVMQEGILAPEHAPLWMQNREDLWNVIETKEKRCDARLARDFTLSLPHQFNENQMQEAVTGFLQTQFVSRGLVCDFAIHAPGDGDKRNYHSHCLITERAATEDGFNARKDRSLNERGKFDEWRAAWEAELNRIFERDQIRDRNGELYFVDRRSYRDRGIEKEPGIHLGPAANKLERAGVQTDAGNFNRRVTERNTERSALQDELARVEDLLQAETRRQEKMQRLLADDSREVGAEMHQRQAADSGGRNPLSDDMERAADQTQAEERRREKIRLLLGDRADTTLTDEQVRDRTRTKSIRQIYGEVGAEIDDAQPVLKPKPRDLGFGREPGI